jgi:hypothetical protein
MSSTSPRIARLASRALIAMTGQDWRGFLQGLITQDVETLKTGEARFGALLTPQGRVLFDLFVTGDKEGCLIECEAIRRETLIQRLTFYRLRAKVDIAASDAPVLALWNAPTAPEGWWADPRLPALGFRRFGSSPAANATVADETGYEAHRLSLGVPGSADWGSDEAYPLEANFDLLGGIDFNKGCFVGQETTSRMKRRGAVKSRMIPIAFRGAAPDYGAELLAGTLRAGRVLSGMEGKAMALLRLDRLDAGPLTLLDGRPWTSVWPKWLEEGLQK